MYTFEFDAKKSVSNLTKHGIDFIEAQKIWFDPNFIAIQAKSIDEPRTLVIGVIESKHYAAITTYRAPNIRIISVRRAREQEVAIYESEKF